MKWVIEINSLTGLQFNGRLPSLVATKVTLFMQAFLFSYLPLQYCRGVAKEEVSCRGYKSNLIIVEE